MQTDTLTLALALPLAAEAPATSPAADVGLPPAMLATAPEDECLGLPINCTTGAEYSGGNVGRLLEAQDAGGYPTGQWCTYNQAQARGYQVRKGEKSTRIVTVFGTKRDDSKGGDAATKPGSKAPAKGGKARKVTRCGSANVFNLAQMDRMSPEQWAAYLAAQAERAAKRPGARAA